MNDAFIHGAHCACADCYREAIWDDEIGKAIARAAEWEETDECD